MFRGDGLVVVVTEDAEHPYMIAFNTNFHTAGTPEEFGMTSRTFVVTRMPGVRRLN